MLTNTIAHDYQLYLAFYDGKDADGNAKHTEFLDVVDIEDIQ